MTSDRELFDEVGLILEGRPDWRYEPSTTPGAAPSWCLVSDGDILLSVTVIDGLHSVYLPNGDKEIDFDSRGRLIEWIDENADRFIGS
jgi:hypothetical protein